jgi:hypothetical protein
MGRPAVTLMFLAGLSAASQAAESDPTAGRDAFDQAQRVVDLQLSTDETKAYDKAWSEAHNTQYPTLGDECFAQQGSEFHFILEFDATGRVKHFFADQDTPMTRCFRHAWVGATYPPPPVAPYFRRMTMFTSPP